MRPLARRAGAWALRRLAPRTPIVSPSMIRITETREAAATAHWMTRSTRSSRANSSMDVSGRVGLRPSRCSLPGTQNGRAGVRYAEPEGIGIGASYNQLGIAVIGSSAANSTILVAWDGSIFAYNTSHNGAADDYKGQLRQPNFECWTDGLDPNQIRTLSNPTPLVGKRRRHPVATRPAPKSRTRMPVQAFLPTACRGAWAAGRVARRRYRISRGTPIRQAITLSGPSRRSSHHQQDQKLERGGWLRRYCLPPASTRGRP
jgi:hypothetical protein